MNRSSCVFVGILTASVALLLLAISSAPTLAGEPSMRTRPNANEVGIWKAYTPKGIKGELDNYDPIGLIGGALIRTDCSINWRDPDNGKLYCFATGTSFNYFQDWPKTYSRKAKDALKRIKAARPSG